MTDLSSPWQTGVPVVDLSWHAMGPIGRGAVTLLVLMLANALVIFCDRLYLYHVARRQSRAFVRDARSALRGGSFKEVTALREKNSQSHVAIVVIAGVTAFFYSPPKFTDFEAIGAAERAFHRSRTLISADLKLALATLLTIASSAPFVGLVGTCFVILDAFRGTAMEKSTYQAMVASTVALSLVPTAIGLLAAVVAVWFHNFLLSCISALESEISEALLETVRYLNAHLASRNHTEGPTLAPTSSILGETDPSGTRLWEAPYDRQRVLLLALWLCGIYLVYIFARAHWS